MQSSIKLSTYFALLLRGVAIDLSPNNKVLLETQVLAQSQKSQPQLPSYISVSVFSPRKILQTWIIPSFIDSMTIESLKNLLQKKSPLPPEFIKIFSSTNSYSQEFKKFIKNEDRISRGDFDDLQFRNKLSSWLKLQVLQLHHLGKEQSFNCLNYQQEFSLWLRFLQELSYTETYMEHFHWIVTHRGIFLDQLLLQIDHPSWKTACAKEQTLSWWKSIQLPWPLDRILIQEAQLHNLTSKERYWIQQFSQFINKHPHILPEDYFTQRQVYFSPGLRKVANLWNQNWLEHKKQEDQKSQQIFNLLDTL